MADLAPLPPARWWEWPTILSLDAPVVALVWQEQLARAGLTRVGWPERVLLGIVVWLIYAADRWIEGMRLDPARVGTHRHGFYIRHRGAVAVVGAALLAAGAAVAVGRLSAGEWWAGLGVACMVLVYLLSHQCLHRDNPWRAPKETCVGVLFAAGCALGPALQPGVHLGAIAGLSVLLALLAFTNCALISAWEESIDRGHGQTSLALQFSFGRMLSRQLAWLGGGLGVAVAALPSGGEVREGAVCVAASSVLLAVVDLLEPRIGERAARVCADVVLLTPVAAWWLAAVSSES